MTPQFTVGVLLYGDYPDLATRCLTPLVLLAREGLIDLRVGANTVSAATEAVIDRLLTPIDLIPVRADPQIYKYPMMRRLFCDPSWSIGTPRIMWFDDDSWIKHPDPVAWLRLVASRAVDADWLGAFYRITLTAQQRKWITTRPWYRGRPLPPVVDFLQGGWWVADAGKFKQVGWPDVQIRHRGGDVMAGVMIDQQGWRRRFFNTGVAINADDQARESRSPRRGYDEPSAGQVGWSPYHNPEVERGQTSGEGATDSPDRISRGPGAAESPGGAMGGGSG